MAPVIGEYISFVRGFSRNAKLFIVSSALQSLSWGVTGVVLNLYFVRSGLAEGFLGALVFLSAAAGVVFALPSGLVSDRFGRRRALIVSGVIATAGSLVQVLFPVPGILVPATVVAGAASMLAQVTGGPILVETSRDHERAHLFGFQAALTMGTSVIGSNLGGLLPKYFGALYGGGPETALALRATLLVGVSFYVFAVLAVLPMTETSGAAGAVPPVAESPVAEPPVAEPVAEPVPARPVAAKSAAALRLLNLANPVLVGKLLIPSVFVGLGAGLIMPLQNVFMERHLGATPAEIGLIFSISSALTGVGALVSPLLARRWGKVRAIAGTQFLSLPFLAVMGLSPWLWVYGVASLVRGSLMNLSNPLLGNFQLEIVEPRERATVNSLLNMVWNGGWAVSGWVGGWLMQNVSYTLPYAFTFVLYTISIVSFYLFFRGYDPPLRRRRPQVSAPA